MITFARGCTTMVPVTDAATDSGATAAARREQLEAAIAAQEALRGVVPDEIVDAAVAALRQRLAASTSEVGRRRQATVLFADVSGYTEMSSRLDAEVVADVMNELWAELDAIIVELGGKVDKHIGDALMAVWGMTATAEDDPERAVRAALSMQHALARRGAKNPLVMRIGINTGPVHMGSVGGSDTEVTAIGDTVNVTSRVEHVAPRGGVLITHDTYRHIRGVFDVQPLKPVRVKGKAEPIRVYVVQGVKERRFRIPTRGVEGVETRMVGRTRELDSLRAEFITVLEQPGIRRVTVIGEAGVGKSRLLYELENWIELHPVRAYLFKGRASAMRSSIALGLLRDVLADRFGVLDNDATVVVAVKLRQGLAPALDEDEADVVGQWLGFDLRSSPAVRRLFGSGQLATAARAHLFRYIESITTEPVAMFLEDLHWADEESLAFIDELVEHSSAPHLLVVGVARPSLLDRPEGAGLLKRSSLSLVLEPLDAGATRALVDEILRQAASVPEELTQLIVERADGNAFYVEELVKMLIDDGVIETGEEGDPWRVHFDLLRPEHVPSTLTGVLQSRLDGLPAVDRDALQRASVVGRVFWDDAVRSLRPEVTTSTADSLELARRRELVLRHESSAFGATVEYAFKHALLRDVTYETVLLRERRRLHGLVAQWMTEHAGQRASEFSTQIASHLRLAGELATAAALLHRSATSALDAGNVIAARRHLEEAFLLWREAGEAAPVDALVSMAEACVRGGDALGAQPYADQSIPLASTPPERARAHFVGSWIASEVGDREREERMLRAALPDAERVGGVLLVARARGARLVGGHPRRDGCRTSACGTRAPPGRAAAQPRRDSRGAGSDRRNRPPRGRPGGGAAHLRGRACGRRKRRRSRGAGVCPRQPRGRPSPTRRRQRFDRRVPRRTRALRRSATAAPAARSSPPGGHQRRQRRTDPGPPRRRRRRASAHP